MPDTGWLIPSKKANTPRKPKAVDTDFLPAALEILEAPPSPVGRTIIWIVISAGLIALIWAIFAQIDMVAVAEGRVIPRSRLQSVEAPEAGVIRAIHVIEGQYVEKDQPLLALDPTFAGADAASARIELETADLARARAKALLQRAAGQPVRFVPPTASSPEAAAAEADAVRARIASLEAELESLDKRIMGANAAMRISEAERQKLLETQPLLLEQDAIQRRLGNEGATTRNQMIEVQRRLIENRRDVEARSAEISQAVSEIEMLERDRAQTLQKFRAQAASEQAEAEAIVATRAEGVRKAITREGYQTLLAPVSGIVNEISVTTLGEVAEAGAPLVTIVPEGEELIVEALVLNRDAGFVRRGQEVVVKLDAYPFTRHGYLQGIVENVSPDATTDDARGLVFPVRVKLTENRLRNLTQRLSEEESERKMNRVGETHVTTKPAASGIATPAPATGAQDASRRNTLQPIAALLSPGMSARAEIITGKRTVMDYILSPISKATQEAARER